MPHLRLGPIRTKYHGQIFTIKERDVHFHDGTSAVYEYCERPNSVSILPFNDKGELLLIKEYRHGYKKNVWFLPSGRMDHPGDTPKRAAQRELREETGYRAKTLKLIHKKTPSNTLIWDIYLFAAKDLVPDPLPRDKGEHIKNHFMPFKKAVRMALDGTIENEFIAYIILRFDYMRSHGQWHW